MPTFPERPDDRNWVSRQEHRAFQHEHWERSSRQRRIQRTQWGKEDEHRFNERQQWRIQNHASAKSNQLLAKSNQLNAAQVALQGKILQAQREGNAIALQSLEVQKQHLYLDIERNEREVEVAKRDEAYQVRRDMQSFAQYRQTPDGKRFLRWAINADTALGIIERRDAEWQTVWDRWRDSVIQPAERDMHENPQRYIPNKPAMSTGIWWVLGSLLGGFGLLVAMISGALSAVGGVMFGLLLAGVGFGFPLLLTIINSSNSSNRRTAEARLTQARNSRVQRFGFDPITAVKPAESWGVGVDSIRADLESALERGAFDQIDPDFLPDAILPELVPVQQIRNPAFHELLSRWEREDEQMFAVPSTPPIAAPPAVTAPPTSDTNRSTSVRSAGTNAEFDTEMNIPTKPRQE